jgi:RNA polymerase sigma factor (sigma-70 family)
MIPFQQVLDAHRDLVWRVCAAAAGRPDADDCFQETWLAALRAYPRLEPGANVQAWLVTIAHRKAIDAHRARAAVPRARRRALGRRARAATRPARCHHPALRR